MMLKRALRRYGAAALTMGMLLHCMDASAQDRAPTPEDAIKVKRLDQLAIAPDGSKIVFRQSELEPSGERRQSALWTIDLARSGSPERFSNVAGDSGVAWSPDGNMIAFLRDVDGVAQVHVMPAKGGDACAVTRIASGVGSFAWSPDSQQLAFSAPGAGTSPAPLPSGVRIFTRADFRSGNDYIDHSGGDQIWVVPVGAACSGPAARQVTGGAVSADMSFWSGDSSLIYFTTRDIAETYYGEASTTLHAVRVSDGKRVLERHLKEPGGKENLRYAPGYVLSPDGKRVAFALGNPDAPGEFAQSDIFVMDLKTGETRNITADYDREIGDGLTWIDDHQLIAENEDEGASNIVRIDIDRKSVTPVEGGQHVVDSFAFASRAGKIVAIRSDFVTPAEIYELSAGAAARPLTGINRPLREALQLGTPERIAYNGPGGEQIHGYLLKPPAFDPAKRYPLIVLAHGGPYAAWTARYDGHIQAIAAAGYLVFYPNPRGSSSYGQAFAAALADSWPGKEYDDIMAGVDYLLERPYVDEKRLGVSGASAGGILTDWAITHTDRFAAAVSVSDIADFSAYWFIGDQPSLRKRDDKLAPWLDPRDRELSPITHGLNVKTPTLFIGGDKDYRTPLAVGGEIMFRLLKYLRVPTALIQFEGAGHAISRTADPRHPALSTRYLIKWMDQYLKGIPAAEFANVEKAATSPASAGAPADPASRSE